MKMRTAAAIALACTGMTALSGADAFPGNAPVAGTKQTAAPRQMEALGRGVVAIRQDDGRVFISWRLLATDPDELRFNLYRGAADAGQVKLNAEPLRGPTDFIDPDSNPAQPVSYFVRPVLGGQEQTASAAFVLKTNVPVRPYLSVPLQTLPGYTPNDASAGDLDGVTIFKWDYENSRQNELFSGTDYDCVSNNGSKSNPCLCADIVGDWREELMCRTRDNRELRIFTTTIPAARRCYTFMHDPVYRLGIACQNVAYNQPAHTGFYRGEGMAPPPRPAIVTPSAAVRNRATFP